ncbi:MAG: hypothetical protein GY945_07900 [Rhodobacteraceae bacterium]|nr:hypothetical protein [Paracoccaceae bacterium]
MPTDSLHTSLVGYQSNSSGETGSDGLLGAMPTDSLHTSLVGYQPSSSGETGSNGPLGAMPTDSGRTSLVGYQQSNSDETGSGVTSDTMPTDSGRTSLAGYQPLPSTESGTSNSTNSVSATGDQYIDGLLTWHAWGDATIYYSFPTNATSYSYSASDDYYYDGISGTLNGVAAAQIVAVQFALDAGSGGAASAGFSVEGITGLGVAQDLTPDSNDHIRVAETSSASVGTAEVADFPGNYVTANVNDNGDVWFGSYSGYIYRSPEAGNYAWATHIHELGHALGLKHGHENSAFGPLPSDMDSMEYTIMTYRSYEDGPLTGYTNETWGYAQSWMMLDIQALQTMYGADFTTNSGNTVYSWDPTSGDTLVNGAVGIDAGGNRIFATVWDGGGIDTYDLSAYTTAVIVDLTPGGHSVFSTTQLAYLGHDGVSSQYSRGNIFNALQYQGDTRSLIENAIGGSGNDVMTGNAADNNIEGRDGDDTIYGVNGADTIYGDLGDDTIYGGNGADTIYGGWDNDYLRGGGQNDHLEGQLGDDTIYGDRGDDTIYGGNGADTIYGGHDNDYMRGGGQNDRLEGQLGDDTIYGDQGNDSIFGGNGEDILYGGYGHDLIRGGANRDIIEGALGNDTIYGDRGDDRVLGGNGNDKVFGGEDHDFVHGGGGNDLVDGGSGNDRLGGGLGSDTFVFADGFGIDTISDFDALDDNEDIDLSDVTAITDYTDLETNHMNQVGADVVIDDLAGNTITLTGVNLADLDEDDFLF